MGLIDEGPVIIMCEAGVYRRPSAQTPAGEGAGEEHFPGRAGEIPAEGVGVGLGETGGEAGPADGHGEGGHIDDSGGLEFDRPAKGVGEDKATFGGTSHLRLIFDPRTFKLKQWQVKDPQGYETLISLFNIDQTTTPDPALFVVNK